MSRLALWLRWSWRDVRRRWLQVTVLALVVALGVGTWGGLRGTSKWRRESNDASFAVSNFHDLRLDLSSGSFAPEGRLLEIVASIPDPARVTGAEERLDLPVQVDASMDGATTLVPGELIGVDVREGAPTIDRLDVRAGAGIESGQAVIDVHFAEANDLPPTGELRLSGGPALPYSGHVLSPEHFVVVSERGGLFAGQFYAILYAPIDVAQTATGHQGEVNGLVLTAATTDLRELQADIDAVFATEAPELGVTFTVGEDEPSFRLLYDDIENDQRFYNIFAGLIFAGATFGAFNLARRLVEAQRHEIGIAMSLGVTPARIAVRPLLVGLQISVLGVLFGLVIGIALGEMMKSLFAEFVPLPVWQTSLNTGAFLQGALLGVALPLIGVAWPVVKAVRVPPNETLAPVHRSSTRKIPLLGRRLRLRGSSLSRLPVRNVFRSVQRTVLTVFAIGAAVAAFLTVLGMVDSFTATIEKAETAMLGERDDRITVDLENIAPAGGSEIAAIGNSPAIAELSAALRLPGTLLSPSGTSADDIAVAIEARDLESAVWHPNLDRPVDPGRPGVILAAKAAADLGVAGDDTVVLRHPVRTGPSTFAFAETELTVLAIHDVPLRAATYVSIEQASLFGLEGAVNTVDVVPEPGFSRDEVKQALFPLDGVSAVQGASETTEIFQQLVDDFLSFLLVLQAVTVALAMLVAFNATSINVDERQREHATMLAFGLPIRSLLRTMLVESLIIGTLGGLVGLGLGVLVVRWIVEVSLPDIVPDLSIMAAVSPTSLAMSLGVGMVAVAASPFFAVRRIRRMNVPSSLRVLE